MSKVNFKQFSWVICQTTQLRTLFNTVEKAKRFPKSSIIPPRVVWYKSHNGCAELLAIHTCISPKYGFWGKMWLRNFRGPIWSSHVTYLCRDALFGILLDYFTPNCFGSHIARNLGKIGDILVKAAFRLACVEQSPKLRRLAYYICFAPNFPIFSIFPPKFNPKTTWREVVE